MEELYHIVVDMRKSPHIKDVEACLRSNLHAVNTFAEHRKDRHFFIAEMEWAHAKEYAMRLIDQSVSFSFNKR